MRAKKLLAAGICITMAASLFAGCNGGGKQNDVGEMTKEEIEKFEADAGGLKLPLDKKGTQINFMTESSNTGMTDSTVIKELSRRTGVKVVITEIPQATMKEKAKVLIASKTDMPDVITDMPSAAGMNSADELYLAGVHVDQYRDPAVLPDSYWKEALNRNINHIPSLIAMAKYELNRYSLDSAKRYAERAIETLTLFNERTQSGEAYYTMGRILEANGDTDKVYDFYYKAYWAADCVAKAMTRIAVIDIKRKDYKEAVRHAENTLDYGRNNNLAIACLAIAKRELGENIDAIVDNQLKKDSLDHTMKFICGKDELCTAMDSDAVQTCLDIAFDLSAMGRYEDIVKLLSGLEKERPDCRKKYFILHLVITKILLAKTAQSITTKQKMQSLVCVILCGLKKLQF